MAIDICNPLTTHYAGKARDDFYNVKHKHAGADSASIYGFCRNEPGWVTVSGVASEMLRRVQKHFFQVQMNRHQLDWELRVVNTQEPSRDDLVGFLDIRGDRVEELITCPSNN